MINYEVKSSGYDKKCSTNDEIKFIVDMIKNVKKCEINK